MGANGTGFNITVGISHAVVAVFGLALGSFLNVCIFRLPRGESIVAPRSRCPHCGGRVRWYDNIPVVSYVVLAGRCRDCQKPISPLYPLVEVSTAVLLLAAFAQFGLSPEFIKQSVLVMLLIILVFTDLTHRKIPHVVTSFGIGVGLLLSLVVPVDDRLPEWAFSHLGFYIEGVRSSVLGSISGAFFGSGLFYGVGVAFNRLLHKQGLGFGDVMLMAMVGTFFGIPLTYLTILMGSLLGVLIAGPLYLVSASFRQDYHWPYGSFLGIAAIYASLGGKALLEGYLHWSGLR